jgi:hypothetical protein
MMTPMGRPAALSREQTPGTTQFMNIVGSENSSSNEPAAAFAAKWRQYERRMTFVYLVLFGLITAALVYFWLARTAGERACKRWLETGEPRLKAITIRASRLQDRTEVTCDEPKAIRYLEDRFANADPWTNSHAITGSVRFPSYVYGAEIAVILHFRNGADYQCPGPCVLSANGLGIYLPGRHRSKEDSPTTCLSFDDPMPDSWRRVLMTLLGPEEMGTREG